MYGSSSAAHSTTLHGHEILRPTQCRLLQLAVLEEHQRKGHGAAIMRRLQEFCETHKPQLLPKMHAQTHAMRFYEAQGWRRCGGEFDEAGIPHVTMIRPPEDAEKLLAASDDRTPECIRACLTQSQA